MSDFVRVMATTRPVTQGGIQSEITKEALDSFVEQTNAGRAMPLTVEHDPSLMPIGKITEAWVESLDSDYALMARVHMEDSYLPGTYVSSGEEIVVISFKDYPRPFTSRACGKALESGDALGVDIANFHTLEDYNRFKDDIGSIDDSLVCESSIVRHSIGPEPLIEFVVSNPYLTAACVFGTWMLHRIEKFLTYTVDETLRKIADDASDSLSLKLKEVVKAYFTHRKHDNRPTTIQLVIPGERTLILLVRTESDEEFPSISLASLSAEMGKYGDIMLEADNVVFERSGAEAWQFLYLTTRSGEVIATQDCCRRTVEAFLKTGQGQSFGGQVPREE